MESPITNCYDNVDLWPKLKTETVNMYTPQKNWTFSHHPAISFFNDRFYATWSNGLVDEDDSGQRVMDAAAQFDRWSGPLVLADAPP